MSNRASRLSDHSETDDHSVMDYGDNIDPGIFEQILEMDEDDPSQEFSKGIVIGFFEQAETTFAKMHEHLEDGELSELSNLGHFLKGSSATLGLTKVKDSCEKIQHFGQHKDETGTVDELDDQVCLDRIKDTLKEAETEYHEVEKKLRDYYKE
ncbi:MAG: hypothetical protein M1833_004146 [Piccolia ochrophora]|nr:MAG: hypothetical protein M1833_004146 [Piccolia ochrophora]